MWNLLEKIEIGETSLKETELGDTNLQDKSTKKTKLNEKKSYGIRNWGKKVRRKTELQEK